MEYVIVRAEASGVHVGELEKIEGEWLYLRQSRRLVSWCGAATLSELAVYGGGDGSLLSVPVDKHRLPVADVCEIIDCEPEGEQWFRSIPAWRAKG